jgi:hypothetical protein
MSKTLLGAVLVTFFVCFTPVFAQTTKEWKAIHLVQHHRVGDSTLIDVLSQATWGLSQEGFDIHIYGWGAKEQPDGTYNVDLVFSGNGKMMDAGYSVSMKTKKVIGITALGASSLSSE